MSLGFDAETLPRPVGWLRGPSFDLTLVVGVLAAALLAGAVIVAYPPAFAPIFLANMWVLGFQHVVATFTRLTFDRRSIAEHRFLVFGLPPLMLATTFAIGLSSGEWILATVYMYWQAFHYARQSYGIAQMYARRPENGGAVNQALTRWMLYAVPLWGVLHRSYQAPAQFLGLDIRWLPTPEIAVRIAGALAFVLVAWWCVTQLRLARANQLPVSHTLYVCSHIVLFAVGYIFIDDVDTGWLVVNIWHNAQYLLFVWYFNNKRFAERVDPERQFLSRLSLRRNAVWYVATCLAISTVAYALLFLLSREVALPAVTLAFLVAQAINYHHYIVDGVVWRRRAVAATQPANG